MYVSLKKQIFCNCQQVEGLQTLYYLETWALRAVLTPSRSLLLFAALATAAAAGDLRVQRLRPPSSLPPTSVRPQKVGFY